MRLAKAGVFLVVVLMALAALAADQGTRNYSIDPNFVPQPSSVPADAPAAVVLDTKDTYQGNARVFIVEKTSRRGWRDHNNHTYDFPFLAFAVNENISLADGETWEGITYWDGSDYGYADSTIEEDNILAYLVLHDAVNGYAEAACVAEPGIDGTHEPGSYTHKVFVEEGTATW